MNRHIVDQLADVRAEIKVLETRETDLKAKISAAMGGSNSLGGDEFIALQKLSTRKGGIDDKAMKAAGIDVDKYRKPDIPALLAALEASEAARVKAEQERDGLKERENVTDELMASQYRAGAQAGWNAAQLIWPKSQEAIARLTNVEKGDLKHIQAANARRALESSK